MNLGPLCCIYCITKQYTGNCLPIKQVLYYLLSISQNNNYFSIAIVLKSGRVLQHIRCLADGHGSVSKSIRPSNISYSPLKILRN